MEIVKDNNSLQSLQNTPSIFTQELQDLINSTRKKLNEQLPKYHPSTLTDEHIFWFLLNDKYNIDNSIKFILKYLEWRNKYSNGQPIQTFEIINEINDNKLFWNKPNKNGSPCLIMKVKNNIPGKHTLEEKMKFVMYNMDHNFNLIKQYRTGKICVIWDREGSDGDKNYDKKFSDAFQDMKPFFKYENSLEYIDKVYVNELGILYTMLWSFGKLFISYKIVSKIVLLNSKKDLLQHFDMDNLPKEYGGNL